MKLLLGYLLVFIIFSPIQQVAAQTATPVATPAPTASTQSFAGQQTACFITQVGNPSGEKPPLPFECSTSTGELGDGGEVLNWAEKITQNLQQGGAVWPDLFNKQQASICNEAKTCAHTQSGNSLGDLYWCTYLVVDSFTLAGFKGLSVGAHGAVVNMAAFWKKTPGYTFLPYNSDTVSDKQNKETLQKLKPGMPYFLYLYPDRTVDEEHTAIIKDIQIDANGNGKYNTLESNSTRISQTFPIDNWVVKNHHHILRGYGGFESQSGNSTDIKASLASLPGNSGGIVILPSGSAVENNSEQQLPSFSVIKLWVAAATYALGTNLSEQYTVTTSDIAPGTGILNQRSLPTTVSYGDLVRFMLVYSDNSATNILINKLGGFSTINNWISQNGFSKTKIQRYLGVTNYTSANDNYTSAKDAVVFMRRLYDKQIVNASVSESIIAILDERSQKENKGYIYLGKKLPLEANLREKSGVGPQVRNDAGSFVTKSGKRVFVAILQSELANETAGEDAIANIAQSIYNNQ